MKGINVYRLNYDIYMPDMACLKQLDSFNNIKATLRTFYRFFC